MARLKNLGFRVLTFKGPVLVSSGNVFRCRVGRGCYCPHGCGEAGERPGSVCAIEVEALRRRPPTVGGRRKP